MLKRGKQVIEEGMGEDDGFHVPDDGDLADIELDEEEDEEMEEQETEEQEKPKITMKKNRVLSIAAKGITARYRHLMMDLQVLLPHSRKESKMDARDPLSAINEICELRSCSHAIYFDTRRHRDLYVSFARCPEGFDFFFLFFFLEILFFPEFENLKKIDLVIVQIK